MLIFNKKSNKNAIKTLKSLKKSLKIIEKLIKN